MQSARIRTFYTKDMLIRVVQNADYHMFGIFAVIHPEDMNEANRALDALIPNKRTVVLTNFGGGTSLPIRAIGRR